VSILTGGIQDAGGVLTPDTERIGNGPAVYYRVKGWQGRIGLIAALSHSFCATCNRLRLSASGMLSPCLSSSAGTDLRVLLRGGKPLAQTIAAVIGSKPASHNFLECRREKAGHSDKAMWNIGG
jgi:cyclic pyranopterin phosphate synthase